jgi:hypothetical protein
MSCQIHVSYLASLCRLGSHLRGNNADSPWYDGETAEAKKLGVAHMDFRMSAPCEMTMEQFNQIIAMLQVPHR